MGKGAPLRWLENRLLARHFRGRGVEIGALWRKFPVPSRAAVYYVDRISDADLQQHYAEVTQPIVPPDVVADATRLPFLPASLDFVIASHVLEHLPFPLAALRHWYDVLRPGGVLLLKIPDKRYTFDVKRERTTVAASRRRRRCWRSWLRQAARISRIGWNMLSAMSAGARNSGRN